MNDEYQGYCGKKKKYLFLFYEKELLIIVMINYVTYSYVLLYVGTRLDALMNEYSFAII